MSKPPVDNQPVPRSTCKVLRKIALALLALDGVLGVLLSSRVIDNPAPAKNTELLFAGVLLASGAAALGMVRGSSWGPRIGVVAAATGGLFAATVLPSYLAAGETEAIARYGFRLITSGYICAVLLWTSRPFSRLGATDGRRGR